MTSTPAAPARLGTERIRSIIELTQSLVRIPSQGGIDDHTPIIEHLTDRMRGLGLRPEVIAGQEGEPVAVASSISGRAPGPHLVLDACLDSAAVGDPTAWARPPFSGDIDGAGWLHGRGAGDSKAAVAIFSHLVAELDHAADDHAQGPRVPPRSGRGVAEGEAAIELQPVGRERNACGCHRVNK